MAPRNIVTVFRVNEDEIFQCCQFNDFLISMTGN